MPTLAIRGGAPVRSAEYPAWPIWDQREIDAVTTVIRSGRWGGYPEPGPHAARFAAAFAAFQGAKHGICMVNGTVTMTVALRAAGIQLGDEVIVPAYTFAATAPLPDGLDEILFAGFIRKKSVELVKCRTIDLEVPADVDFVLEGYVQPNESRPEGPFGDHTGF